ncbi:MAG: 1-acyl-sn-glycerol-3-phosphate acyltransferase [Clostridium sp.]|nr:1-acyl-sn-glycerol-3-phosphate acyltransferase [Prevotella sp.]MCM1428771.1 1-acyl-sn-glycerol-3-phosphate acyltransferase [Clostridium sp.]MCM1475146.1 1-acyl-sn-glycerol-3-phosphate acyltransferase [Muribaculaceae bacterium]
MANIWGYCLRLAGWKVEITAPRRQKCVICVAPHTSNWDFIIGLASYKSLGREANFLMKKFWFFFPLKYLLKSLGGIPVPSGASGSGLTEAIIHQFEKTDYMNLAVTPEGTRSLNAEWRSGFLRIAIGAHVPIQLGLIDFKHKRVIIQKEFEPSGDIVADMQTVKAFYANSAPLARYPDKFSI